MKYASLSLLAMVLLLGCRASKPATSSSVIEGIVVDVWASSDCIQPGETLRLRATATNRGTRAHSVQLSDRPVLDLVVRATDKTTHWSDGKPITPNLTSLELKPGESKTIEMNWLVQCCDSLYVTASFAYDKDAGVVPTTLVQVQHCTGPLGP